MRVFLMALAMECGGAAGRPAGDAWGPGIPAEGSTGDSTGDRPRLDLPAPEPLGTSTTGEDSAGSTSTGAPVPADMPGETGGTATGEASTGSGTSSTGAPDTTGGTSTTGQPPAPVCGDGTCDPGEHAACYVAGQYCKPDCYKAPECLSDCPCAGIVDGFCDLSPGTCDMTAPGGPCDPDGDGMYFDADFTAGWLAWQAKCK